MKKYDGSQTQREVIKKRNARKHKRTHSDASFSDSEIKNELEYGTYKGTISGIIDIIIICVKIDLQSKRFNKEYTRYMNMPEVGDRYDYLLETKNENVIDQN